MSDNMQNATKCHSCMLYARSLGFFLLLFVRIVWLHWDTSSGNEVDRPLLFASPLVPHSLLCGVGASVNKSSLSPRSGKLRTQKLKSHLMRTQSLKVLPLKPRVSEYVAMHATLTASDFFLAKFYPSGPFTCIKPSRVFPVLAVAITGSCVGPQNKIGHPAGCKFPRWVLTECK